jgi:CrcB protein
VLVLAVSLAAGLGAVARYVADLVVTHRLSADFPAGTLVVNLTGSFVLGLAVGLSLHHGLSTNAALVLGTGFAGGYTTFSTFAWETVALGERGSYAEAALNVACSVVIGLAAAAAGGGRALL